MLAALRSGLFIAWSAATMVPYALAYVFKRELLYIPFFGWASGRLDPDAYTQAS